MKFVPGCDSCRASTVTTRLAAQPRASAVLNILAAALCGVATVSAATPLFAQEPSSDGLWEPVPEDSTEIAAARADERVPANKQKIFKLNIEAMKSKLAKAPAASDDTAPASAERVEVSIPLPNGTYQRFEVTESDVAEPELSAKFPELKSYAGQSLDGTPASIAIDISPEGFSAQVRTDTETFIVRSSDPSGKGELYTTFDRANYKRRSEEKRCLVATDETSPASAQQRVWNKKFKSGGMVRTYRLAMAATGEYSQFHGGSVAQSLAAIRRTVNRLNQVYLAELSVRLVLVGDNDKIIFTDPDSDPFSNHDVSALIDQSQAEIDKTVGDANYDVGHTVGAGSNSGLALLGVVGRSGSKASGVTGAESPLGDPFDVDYVAHEIGHQFGANHTFNGVTGSCSGGNRNEDTAFEPGSGTTILGYAGICGEDDVQPHSHAYFHFASLEEIASVVSGEGQPAGSSNGNQPPEVKALKPQSGTRFMIPRATPFALDASAQDPDGDRVTLTWEQVDLGPSRLLGEPDIGKGPLFRSHKIAAGATARVFPQLDGALSGVWPKHEVTPQTKRDINFRVTARDERASGGAVGSDEVAISVVKSAGPFVVTEPKAAKQTSQSFLVKWNVANTNAAPIRTSKVDIWLSNDGGKTFAIRLAEGAPNTGSKRVAIPESAGQAQLRIKVQAVDNIYFALSPTTFSINQ